MNIIAKLFKADKFRKSRWHDENGTLVSFQRFVTNGLRAYSTGVIRLLFNRRPILPWISYDAAHVISTKLSTNSIVLEFGSGMSTIWLGKKAGRVISIENNEEWISKVQEYLDKYSLKNVELIHSETFDDYEKRILSIYSGPFDLILIDGEFRDKATEIAVKYIANNGIIYLDNSDRDLTIIGSEIREAKRNLLEFANLNSYKFVEYTDYAPTQFSPSRGLMISVKKH